MSGSLGSNPRRGARAATIASAALLLASCSDGGLDFGAWMDSPDEPGRILLNCAVHGQLALDVVVQGRGTVERSDAALMLDARSCHDAGETVQLQAVAHAGWMFAGFTGDAASLLPDLTVQLEGDSRVTATFERIRESDLPQMLLPFPAGVSAVVLQGPFGPYTHGDEYAWDFRMPVGTSVLAARGGIVVDLREDQPSHGPDDPVMEGPANFVMLDHGDGLLTRYVHLDEMGALVEIGDAVVLGQVIAVSGNSGLSFEPHLHFETRSADGSPRASGFAESPRPDGVAEEGDVLRSRNRAITPTDSGRATAFRPRIRVARSGVLARPWRLEAISKPLSPLGRGRERGDLAGDFDPPPTPPFQEGEFCNRLLGKATPLRSHHGSAAAGPCHAPTRACSDRGCPAGMGRRANRAPVARARLASEWDAVTDHAETTLP